MHTNHDTKRLVIDIIAYLVYKKTQMYELILRPAGISDKFFANLLKQRNVEGKPLTKRDMGTIIVQELEKKPEYKSNFNSIIKVAANWNQFHLTDNEMLARATVQKAREVLNIIEILDEKEKQILREEKEKERKKLEEERRAAKVEMDNEIQKQSKLLLIMYDELVMMKDNPQKRGLMLEQLMNMLFNVYDIALMQSFRRNEGGEQIDGAFKLDGWHYLVEMKWTNQLTDMKQLDALYGKVARSGKQTMGLFLSIGGWSSHVIPLMKQQPDKSIFLMDGFDLRMVLTQDISLIDLLQKKIAKFNIESEPFLSSRSLIF
ncbi:restriction endonuclease [Paenibacillus doosanensis]|uniref:restriction endonuclease n=1 Tax=Paenibacillus doosanensis TaxID=1229154 RepID=UPI00217F76CD|nr:restriction endonuclease [Paenibacillus doosanensis]MCS7465005.1 restriction endonuclease [Paenibacillus doosanensis]